MCNLKDLNLTKKQMLVLKNQLEAELTKKTSLVDPCDSNLEWSTEIEPDQTWNKAIKQKRKDGWRLPERWELIRLIDWCLKNNFKGFEDMKDLYFWSSSSYAGSSVGAWVVCFDDGYVVALDKYDVYAVRCVRSATV